MEKIIIFPSHRHFPQPFGHRNWRRWCWAPLGPWALGRESRRTCTGAELLHREVAGQETAGIAFFLGIRNHDDGHWWLFHEIWDQEWLVDDWWIHDYIILDEMFGCWNSQKKKSAWWLFHALDDSCSVKISLLSVDQCLTGATGNVPSSSIMEPIRSPVSSTFTGPVKWRACATSTWATSWKPWLFWSQNVKPYGFPYIKNVTIQ